MVAQSNKMMRNNVLSGRNTRQYGMEKVVPCRMETMARLGSDSLKHILSAFYGRPFAVTAAPSGL